MFCVHLCVMHYLIRRIVSTFSSFLLLNQVFFLSFFCLLPWLYLVQPSFLTWPYKSYFGYSFFGICYFLHILYFLEFFDIMLKSLALFSANYCSNPFENFTLKSSILYNTEQPMSSFTYITGKKYKNIIVIEKTNLSSVASHVVYEIERSTCAQIV